MGQAARISVSLFLSICNGDALPKPEDYVRKDLGERARYLYRRQEDFKIVYCYYCPREAGRSDAKRREYIVADCYNINVEIRDEYEKDNKLFPYCRKGKKIACPALTKINNGKWDCGAEDVNEVRVYKSCQPTCVEGYHLDLNVSYRCGELRQWHGNVSTARCLKNDPVISTGIKMTTNSLNTTVMSFVKFENNVNFSVVSGAKRDLADDSTVLHVEQGSEASYETVSPKLKPTVVSMNKSDIDDQDSEELKTIIGITIGCVIGIAVCIIFGIICVYVTRKGRRQKKKSVSSSEDTELGTLLDDVTQQLNDKKETEFLRNSTASSLTATESSRSGSDKTEDTNSTLLDNAEDLTSTPESKEEDFPDIPNDGYISGASALSKPLGSPGDLAADSPHVPPGQSDPPNNQEDVHHQHPVKTGSKEDESISGLPSDGCISGTSALSKPLGIPGDLAADRPHVAPGQSVPGQSAPGQSAPPSDQKAVHHQRPVKTESRHKASVTGEDICVLPSKIRTEKIFILVEGSEIYISLNCKKQEGDEFYIQKHKHYRGKQFHPYFTFIHVIESVQVRDAGEYCWRVENATDPKRKLSGSFVLEVTRSQSELNILRPSEPQYIVKAQKPSGCTFKVSSFLEYSNPQLVKDLYYVLDYKSDWYPLARALLPHKNKYLFKSIKYHKRGDPEDGPSEYILKVMFCAENFSVGDIVEYFTQEKVNRKNFLKEKLLKEHYTECTMCQELVRSIDFEDILSSDDSHC